MLTTLATLKSRLALTDTIYDPLLTAAIAAGERKSLGHYHQQCHQYW
jgi:hypothetical protein